MSIILVERSSATKICWFRTEYCAAFLTFSIANDTIFDSAIHLIYRHFSIPFVFFNFAYCNHSNTIFKYTCTNEHLDFFKLLTEAITLICPESSWIGIAEFISESALTMGLQFFIKFSFVFPINKSNFNPSIAYDNNLIS